MVRALSRERVTGALRPEGAELGTANKPTEFNDYSGCTTWGIKGKHLFLIGLFRRRLDYPTLKRAVREQQSLFNANEVLIEDKASGTQLIQELVDEGWLPDPRQGADCQISTI